MEKEKLRRRESEKYEGRGRWKGVKLRRRESEKG
jgi:hypothetical protein